MIKTSLTAELTFGKSKPNITPLLETSFSKEIRIVFKKGQVMKSHKTPFPIVVSIFEGAITFGVSGEDYALKRGDVVSLDPNVVHHLEAKRDSIVRLTLVKQDTIERVKDVAS
ncbi:cupin domain-containing protein [Aquimarina rhabdastrellae]